MGDRDRTTPTEGTDVGAPVTPKPHEPPEGRWRKGGGKPPPPPAPKRAKPAKPTPSPFFDAHDTKPRFIPPEEATDPNLIANLGDGDLVESVKPIGAPVAPVLQDFAADPRFAPPSGQPLEPPKREPPKAPPSPPPLETAVPNIEPFNTKGMFVDSVPSLPPMPLFRPPDFATAGDDIMGFGEEAESDVTIFERHLARYVEDFDDDENRIALELMAQKLDRWNDIVVEAKRHLARLTGTTGEDRIWAHLSIWNERARGEKDPDREVPTSRSGEIKTPAGPDLFGADYTMVSNFAPPPIGEGLFQWPPPAPTGDEDAALLDENDLEPESLAEIEPESIEIEPESAPKKVVHESGKTRVAPPPQSAPLSVADDGDDLELLSESSPDLSDLAPLTTPPETEAGVDIPPPPSSGKTASFTFTDRPEDSRTVFMQHTPSSTAAPMPLPMPLPPATDTELPLDASDLIEDEEEISPMPPLAGRSKVNVKPEVAERRAERQSRLAQLRAEQEARAKERRAASPSVEPPRSKSAPPPPMPLPKPQTSGIDPSVFKTGEFEAALAKDISDYDRARILLERARREQKKGQRERAIDGFRDALTFDPTSREAIDGLEQLYRETKNTPRLVEILEQKLDLAKTDPLRVDALVAIAEIYENELGDLSGAMARLERAHALAPRHVATLQAIARCHGKLGDHAAQIEDLRKLLRGETARSEKLELLLEIAKLQETKLDDPEAAVRTYEQVLVDHPQYKTAFEDLARLADKSGSWRARAKLIEHQVELAKEPKRQAQLLVELGDLLALAERDPDAAKKHYERAAKVFPSYAPSWRGLEQLAAWAGDEARAEFYLEQRVRHTGNLVERATVLIELAHYRGVVLGKQTEAVAAYEAAHKADPTNEIAAGALLGPFVAQKRFAEAAVLCDVLYRAALKKDDRPRMLEVLETSWQVASAMGNRGQLLAVAAARFKLAPDEARFRESFIDVAHSARESEDALRRVRGALDLALERTGDDIEALSVLGELFRGAGDDATAENCFERVLLANPVEPRALAFLSQRAEVRNVFRRAAALKERLARETREDQQRFDLLLCAGDLWLRSKGQVGAALRAYEEALEIRPQDQLLLRTLHGLYVDQEAWDRAAHVQRGLADLEVEPDRKAKLLTALGAIIEDQLDDPSGAADVLEEVLELDATRLDAFERLVRILTRQKDWIGLANAYRHMIGKLDEKKDAKLAYALHHQLGLVYRDRVGDAERALKSFTHAATLRPDDLEARKIVTELLVVTQRLDAAVDVARATLKKDPLDQQLYRDLYELFLRAHAYDKAWCVAEAMSVLGPLTDTERQFVEDYPPVSPAEIPASLLATAWPTHIHHQDLDRTLSSALQIAVAVYLRARLQQAAPPPLGVPLEHDTSSEGARVLASFRNAAEVLACQMPALHGTPVPGALFTTVLAHHPTISVSLATSSTVADDLLNFLATKRLAEQQPALRARSLFPSVQELKQLFFTTTQLATSGPTSMMRPGWDGGLGAVMTPDERAALRGLVAGVASSGQKLDVKRWLQLAEVTAMRAGMLVCGSVLNAQRAMQLEPRMPDDLGPQQWLAELGLYSTSEQYFELRETIHVAI